MGFSKFCLAAGLTFLLPALKLFDAQAQQDTIPANPINLIRVGHDSRASLNFACFAFSDSSS